MISINIHVQADTAAEFATDLKGLAAALEAFAGEKGPGTAEQKAETPKAKATRGSTKDPAAVKTIEGEKVADVEPQPQPEAKSEPEAPVPTIDDIRSAMTSVIEALGDDGPMAAMNLLKEVADVAKASEVPAEKRAAYIKAAAELVEKSKK